MKSNQAAIVIAVCFAASVVEANEVDRRAATECASRGKTFVAVQECLPGTHIGFKVFDAFDTAYGEQGASLKAKCLELNKGETASAAVCVREAIKQAVDLKKLVPADTKISDPLYDVVSDAKKYNVISRAHADASKLFPRWMGIMHYFPYK